MFTIYATYVSQGIASSVIAFSVYAGVLAWRTGFYGTVLLDMCVFGLNVWIFVLLIRIRRNLIELEFGRKL